MTSAWGQIVNDLQEWTNEMAGEQVIGCEDIESNITFIAGNPSTEMLKVSKDAFYVRGVKVTQDDQEAETVYNAFRAWMVWAELNRK